MVFGIQLAKGRVGLEVLLFMGFCLVLEVKLVLFTAKIA